jgi:hypothetical protein
MAERKRLLGRYRQFEVNIKMALREVGCEDVNWIQLPEDSI